MINFACPVTFLVAKVISYVSLNDTTYGIEPRFYPPCIPFLGNWISFLFTRKSFVQCPRLSRISEYNSLRHSINLT